MTSYNKIKTSLTSSTHNYINQHTTTINKHLVPGYSNQSPHQVNTKTINGLPSNQKQRINNSHSNSHLNSPINMNDEHKLMSQSFNSYNHYSNTTRTSIPTPLNNTVPTAYPKTKKGVNSKEMVGYEKTIPIEIYPVASDKPLIANNKIHHQFNGIEVIHNQKMPNTPSASKQRSSMDNNINQQLPAGRYITPVKTHIHNVSHISQRVNGSVKQPVLVKCNQFPGNKAFNSMEKMVIPHRQQKPNLTAEQYNSHATKIQAWWRGCATRRNPRIIEKLSRIRMSRIEEHILNIYQQMKLYNEERKIEKEMRKTQLDMLQMMWEQINNIRQSVDEIKIQQGKGITTNEYTKNASVLNHTKNDNVDEPSLPIKKQDETNIDVTTTLKSETNPNQDVPHQEDVPTKPENIKTAAVKEDPFMADLDELEKRVKDYEKLSKEDRNFLLNNVTSTIMSLQTNLAQCIIEKGLKDSGNDETEDSSLLKDSPTKKQENNPINMKTSTLSDTTNTETSINANKSGTHNESTTDLLSKSLIIPEAKEKLSSENMKDSIKSLESRLVSNKMDRSVSLDKALEQLDVNKDCPIKYPQLFSYLVATGSNVAKAAGDDIKLNQSTNGDEIVNISESPNPGQNNLTETDELTPPNVDQITEDIVNSILLKAVKKYKDSRAYRSVSARPNRFLDIDLTQL